MADDDSSGQLWTCCGPMRQQGAQVLVVIGVGPGGQPVVSVEPTAPVVLLRRILTDLLADLWQRSAWPDG